MMNDYFGAKRESRGLLSQAMSSPSRTVQLPGWLTRNIWFIGFGALLVSLVGVLSTWWIQHHDFRTTPYLLSIVGFCITAAFLVLGWIIDKRMRSDFVEMKRRHQDMFGRAGISIWQEDWSAVGEAIEALQAEQVSDIVGWFADRPEEARRLHALVRVTDVNWHACYLMRADNPEQLLGSLPDVVPGSFQSFSRWLAFFCSDSNFYAGENRLRRLDGEYYDGYITAAKPVDLEGYRQVMVSVLDITKYKKDSQLLAEAKERLARVQSVITAGTLAASIAHEINSTLAAVTANSAACVRWLNRTPADIHEASIAASAALDAVERTQVVVNNTKSYFSRVRSSRKRTDLANVIRDSFNLIEREIVELDVKLQTSVEDGLFVFCDPVQIQQVFINLCSNAIQAMKGTDKRPELTISAVRESNGIAVYIQDNGPGIDDSLLDKIFEPFYTTKDEGMGMGLAICRSCIESHGGWIAVSSDRGEGALFKLMLPTGNQNEQCKS